MQHRTLGTNGLEVSALGFGCMGDAGADRAGLVLAQKPWIAPIPGTTKRHRLEENLGATQIQLTADDLSDIDRAASEIAVHGARYPEHLQMMVGR